MAGADCGDVGSSCFDSCVSYPNAPYEGDCRLELKAYLDCWWQAAAYECDADQRTQPVGCDTERTTHLTCANEAGGAGAGDGGAGGNDSASSGAPDAAGAGVGGATETEGDAGAGTGGVAGTGG